MDSGSCRIASLQRLVSVPDGARRALTFLEQQPEVDADRLRRHVVGSAIGSATVKFEDVGLVDWNNIKLRTWCHGPTQGCGSRRPTNTLRVGGYWH